MDFNRKLYFASIHSAWVPLLVCLPVLWSPGLSSRISFVASTVNTIQDDKRTNEQRKEGKNKAEKKIAHSFDDERQCGDSQVGLADVLSDLIIGPTNAVAGSYCEEKRANLVNRLTHFSQPPPFCK